MTEKKPQFKYSKYEKARIIGSRALQISMGAPFGVKISQEELAKMRYNPVEIAKLEFENDAIPISIKRVAPELPKKDDPKKMAAAPVNN